VELAGSEDAKPEMRLDTVILDTDAEQVLLLWRGYLLLPESIHDVRSLNVAAKGFPLR
jgi:hypothetical protein